MAVPKFYEFMKPFLLAIRDGKTYSIKQLRDILAKELSLSIDDLKELLPSGSQTVFSNRVQWAGFYLFKAGLVIKPSRGNYIISEEGLKVLEENPSTIDVDFLTKYDSFKEFQSPKSGTTDLISKEGEIETPDYAFEDSFKKINETLTDEILLEIVKISPSAFEQLVIDLLQAMGYGSFDNSGRTTPLSGDEGIDGVIMEDKLGFNLIYIQAKKWDIESTVGRPDIQNFVGAISGKGGNGLFVTTAKFSKPAIDYAELHHIILIDGRRLARLMIEHNFGVSVKKVFQIKELDTDTFERYSEL